VGGGGLVDTSDVTLLPFGLLALSSDMVSRFVMIPSLAIFDGDRQLCSVLGLLTLSSGVDK
jgi:hypothetical protein